MSTKTIALLAGSLITAAGVGAAVGDLGSDDDARERAPQELEVRKDDGFDDVELVDEEDDDRDDRTGDRDGRGDDRSKPSAPSQDPKTGSGDNTGGSGDTKGTGWTGDTFDGDRTDGNDGTGGGDNTYVAPAADSYVAPAPAPAPAYYGGDDGGSYSGGGSDG